MCEPTTMAIAMFAMSAGSAVMQHQQASAQADMQTAAYKQNRQNALADMRNQYAATGQRQQQEQQATAQQIQQRTLQARQEEASARVAAGEAGIQGNSVDAIMRQISGLASGDVSTMQQNREWSIDQMNSEMLGQRSAAQSRINSMSRGVKPSKAALAFKIGEAAAGSYNGYTAQTGSDPAGDWARNLFSNKSTTTQ